MVSAVLWNLQSFYRGFPKTLIRTAWLHKPLSSVNLDLNLSVLNYSDSNETSIAGKFEAGFVSRATADSVRSKMEPRTFDYGSLVEEEDIQPDSPTIAEDDISENDLNLRNGVRNDKYAPSDRFNLALLIMVFLGMGGMYPWNFFITAASYFRYSLRDIQHPANPSTYEKIFENALSIISTGTGVIALIFNTGITRATSFRVRIYLGLAIILVIFVVTTVIASKNTDNIQQGFFIVTMVDVFIINFASSVVNGALFGVLGCLPSRFATAMMIGQTLAGIFAALCSIFAVVTHVGDVDQDATIKHQAVAYFASAIVATFLCILAFTAFLRLPIVNFYTTASVVVVAEVSEVSVVVVKKEKIPWGLILKRTWHHAATLVLTFAVTLSVFPAIATNVRSTHEASGSLTNNQLFLPLACFLIVNAGDLSGRLSHGFAQWPNPQQGLITFGLSLLRLGFIPLFLFCNIVPRNYMPSVFGDATFVVLMATMAFSNGYLGNLGIMYGAKLVPVEYAETTGSMMGLCINIGLLLGSALSFALLFVV